MKSAALFLVFSLLVLTPNLMAKEKIKGEICFVGGLFVPEGYTAPFGAASLGIYYKAIGVEVSGAILGRVTVIGSNFVAGAFNSRNLIPYVTAGIWTTTWGGYGFNFGVGIKIKVSKSLAIRAEYRRYFFTDSDWEMNALAGGISLFL